jgi:hypothetical protein
VVAAGGTIWARLSKSVAIGMIARARAGRTRRSAPLVSAVPLPWGERWDGGGNGRDARGRWGFDYPEERRPAATAVNRAAIGAKVSSVRDI